MVTLFWLVQGRLRGKSVILFSIPPPSPQTVVYFICLPESEVQTVVKDSFPVERLFARGVCQISINLCSCFWIGL